MIRGEQAKASYELMLPPWPIGRTISLSLRSQTADRSPDRTLKLWRGLSRSRGRAEWIQRLSVSHRQSRAAPPG